MLTTTLASFHDMAKARICRARIIARSESESGQDVVFPCGRFPMANIEPFMHLSLPVDLKMPHW